MSLRRTGTAAVDVRGDVVDFEAVLNNNGDELRLEGLYVDDIERYFFLPCLPRSLLR